MAHQMEEMEPWWYTCSTDTCSDLPFRSMMNCAGAGEPRQTPPSRAVYTIALMNEALQKHAAPFNLIRFFLMDICWATLAPSRDLKDQAAL